MLTQIEKEQLKREINNSIRIVKRSDEATLDKVITGTSSGDVYEDYDYLYRHATEDIRSYTPSFNHPTSVLTIGGSGDQLLNAINIGAKKIDVFDKNRLSKHNCALKVTAAKTLSREDLIAYFYQLRKEYFDILSSSLPEESHAYWESLYELFSSKELKNNLFRYKYLGREVVESINPYLDRENYVGLKDKIASASVNYIDASFYELPKYLGDNKYDVINLSNIYEYINYKHVTKEVAEEYRDFIIKELLPHLNPDGVILVAYMYAFNDEVKAYVDKRYKENKEAFSDIRPAGYYHFLDKLRGTTSQNLAYSFLLDAFQNYNTEKLLTNNIEYGMSFDKSHDLALLLRK